MVMLIYVLDYICKVFDFCIMVVVWDGDVWVVCGNGDLWIVCWVGLGVLCFVDVCDVVGYVVGLGGIYIYFMSGLVCFILNDVVLV